MEIGKDYWAIIEYDASYSDECYDDDIIGLINNATEVKLWSLEYFKWIEESEEHLSEDVLDNFVTVDDKKIPAFEYQNDYCVGELENFTNLESATTAFEKMKKRFE